MAVHGDIIEITYNHPTIGTGVFSPKANEGNTFDVGGIRANDDANMVTGNGSIMWQLNRAIGSFEILVENDYITGNDTLKASLLQADPVDADWTVTHINGNVYKGTGRPVGDLQVDMNAGTFTLKVVAPKWEIL